jgi:hypothetical protein
VKTFELCYDIGAGWKTAGHSWKLTGYVRAENEREALAEGMALISTTQFVHIGPRLLHIRQIDVE